MMKNSSTKDWLIDSVMLMLLTGVAVFLLPLISAWFAALHSIVLAYLVPHVMVVALLGLVAAWLIRIRKLLLALLPAILLCLFDFIYMSFGSESYPWGHSRQDFTIVGSWLLLLTVALLCARAVLKHRQDKTEPLDPLPAGNQ